MILTFSCKKESTVQTEKKFVPHYEKIFFSADTSYLQPVGRGILANQRSLVALHYVYTNEKDSFVEVIKGINPDILDSVYIPFENTIINFQFTYTDFYYIPTPPELAVATYFYDCELTFQLDTTSIQTKFKNIQFKTNPNRLDLIHR